ncbi:MAG: hypothetical protein AB7S26_04730 [Sandaracinaceae bacterium]
MAPRVAILSLHSHADRSFLDDRELALVSGDLRRAGVDNELVVAHVPDDAASVPAELVALLAPFDTLIYERVWSRELIEALRRALPGRRLIACEGEHALLAPPADVICRGDLRRTVPAVLAWLDGSRAAPPGTRERVDGAWREVRPTAEPSDEPLPWEPNLAPRFSDGEAAERYAAQPVSVIGNPGCPFQADARANPLYEGARLPDGMGRGCAFCTTGNRYEPSPPDATRERVLERIRYVRAHGARDRIVLKDQNPFAWLGELVARIGEERLGPLTLMLETRVDWFVRNARRFERALEQAEAAEVTIAPYLIGIESFSQAELDRFNKGVDAEDNIRFLDHLDEWAAKHPRTLDLSHAAFGFVLFTPWTTLADLRINHRAIQRTRFDRFRGSLLLSRARLYPDTALYYLAERDGLLCDAWPHEGADNAARYGYFPGHPWRFADPVVERLSALAATLSVRSDHRDQVGTLGRLLDAFERGVEPTIAEIERASPRSASPELEERLARLLRPIELEAPFEGEWAVAGFAARPNRMRLRIARRNEAFFVDLVPRSSAPAYARTRHYDVRYVGGRLAPERERALRTLARALVRNDG